MNYYSAKELAASFQTVRQNTIQIAEDIPEQQYGYQAGPETRTVEKILTHIALSYRFSHQIHAVERRATLEGFDFRGMMEKLGAEEAQSRTKAEVIDLLKRNGEIWAQFVESTSEEFLGESVEMPHGATPPSKSRFEILISVKEHEMHHRGQLMLIERMIGIVPHLTRQFQERMAQAAKASS
jgi:uncharacterized damage-inducible protein DinB